MAWNLTIFIWWGKVPSGKPRLPVLLWYGAENIICAGHEWDHPPLLSSWRQSEPIFQQQHCDQVHHCLIVTVLWLKVTRQGILTGSHIPWDKCKIYLLRIEPLSFFMLWHFATLQPAPTTESEIYLCIFDYIDRLFAIVRPRKLLYMAIGKSSNFCCRSWCKPW